MSDSQNFFNENDIAVIGMSGTFPGASDINEFWSNLCDGKESVSFFSDDELISEGISLEVLKNPNYVKAGGVLEDVAGFDAGFFGYSPGEASMLDPQHRFFLEHCWMTLEDAGYNPEKYEGLIGVFAGASFNTYLFNNLYTNRELIDAGGGYHMMVASDKDFIATKASYKLNLKGPSITIQTACSTSLVAIHIACQSLRNGECDMALAGGVSIRVPQKKGYMYQEGIVLSPDGHCRAFDSKAKGTVIGNGLGVVALKLLKDAVADGDNIYAVVKGSTINNDGALKAGYTAPGLDAQAAAIMEAHGVAGVNPEGITYIEAHGTGTAIGDPIEISALTKAFRRSTDKTGYCAIGSVKTNIGHLDAAAGVAGFIKTVMALKNGKLPPSLNFDEPNPKIDFNKSPFYVNTVLSDWNTGNSPRRAGVSSFGIGGTNAHAILEEAPGLAPSGQQGAYQLLVLSAKSESALDKATENLARYLEENPEINMDDVAYTLQTGRKTFNHRRILVCKGNKDATESLNPMNPQRVFTSLKETEGGPVAFMFTGQGAQYVDMGLELYKHVPEFRSQVDACCEMLHPHLGFDLRTVLYPKPEDRDFAAKKLEETSVTQPVLFVIEYAAARLWMQYGVIPKAMIGHSIGEYVAACLAGIFSLEDALRLVAARGRLMQQMPRGAMLAVPLPEEQVKQHLNEELSIGVINGPENCVVSGRTDKIEILEKQLASKGMVCRRLHTSHAFHSHMMEPVLKEFVKLVGQVNMQPPKIPIVSNLTGTWLKDSDATDPRYWADHLRQTVRFSDGIKQLMKNPEQILLEIGPGILSTLVIRHPDKIPGKAVVSTLPRPQEQQSDMAFMLLALGKVWLEGGTVDWKGLYADKKRFRVSLPKYPFEHERYWIEPQKSEIMATNPDKGKLKRNSTDDWFYVPSWKRSAFQNFEKDSGEEKKGWLLFSNGLTLGNEILSRLKSDGHDVISVRHGSIFEKIGSDEFIINAGMPEHLQMLFDELESQGKIPGNILHMWSVTGSDYGRGLLDRYEALQELGFYSLVLLSQEISRRGITDGIKITVLSDDMHDVTGNELVMPEKATLMGPVNVINHEFPGIKCRSVDIDSRMPEDILTNLVYREVTSGTSDLIVAIRGPYRWIRSYGPVKLQKSKSSKPSLKENGVYLITGGFGGIGFTFAKYLGEAVKARLVLVGRSVIPDTVGKDTEEMQISEDGIVKKIRELEVSGAEVLAFSADVADYGQMKAVVNKVLKRFGKIDGVIHSAGIPGGGIMQLKTREQMERIMEPKLKGTLILNEVLKDINLDFMLLCSSINAVIGRMGQVDYFAANAFLDAFAGFRKSGGYGETYAVNWDTWRDVGMAADLFRSRISHLDGTKSHPLLGVCILKKDNEVVYSLDLDAKKNWELYEHGVAGKPTLPGTAYLEMVCAIIESSFTKEALEFQDVHFLTPLILEEGKKEVRTKLKRSNDVFMFSVASSSGEFWQEHARGKVLVSSGSLSKQNIEDIKESCREIIIDNPLDNTNMGQYNLEKRVMMRNSLPVDSLVISHSDESGMIRQMEFGPRWQCLKWAGLGENQGLALFELDGKFESELGVYRLHPALLDFATSFLRLFKASGSYLPLSYRTINVYGPLSRRIYSHVRFIERPDAKKITISADVTIYGENGDVLADIKEFTVIRVDNMDKLVQPVFLNSEIFGEEFDIQTMILKEDMENGISQEEGLEIFQRVLGSGISQVVVSATDLFERMERSSSRSASFLKKDSKDNTNKKEKHKRPSVLSIYAPPQNEMEKNLTLIWEDVLGIEQVGINDNFFELGGDSLLITQVHSRFIEKFGYEVSVSNLLQYPTITDLASFIKTRDKEKENDEETGLAQIDSRTSKQKEVLRHRKERMKNIINTLGGM